MKKEKLTIELNNKTHYNSKDLKRLFLLTLRKYREHTLGTFKFTRIQVRCVYARKKDGFCGGYAYLNKNYIVMKLQKEPRPYAGRTFEQEIANTFLHELDHCRGLSHSNMIDDHRRDTSFITSDITVSKRAPKVKVKPGDEHKLAALHTRMDVWSKKAKRAYNAMKTISRKIKYYENKMAAKEWSPSPYY